MRSYRHNRFSGDRPAESAPVCEHPGCTQPGVYRAPRDRTLSSYVWLCLEHVREYNQAWDYYAGMNPEEIEREIERDTVWQRPTWRLGAGRVDLTAGRMRDSFSIFEGAEMGPRAAPEKPRHPPGSTGQALEILGLTQPLTRQTLKRRYHELVKLHHPDRNGGDKAAEERLKAINQAYAVLMRQMSGEIYRTAV